MTNSISQNIDSVHAGAGDKSAENPPLFRLADYAPTPYAIPVLELDIDLKPRQTRVKAKLHIEPRQGTEAGAPLILDGGGLKLTALSLDGEALGNNAYSAAPDRLEIFNPPAAPFTLEITVEINPDANRALMGLYRSNGIFCSQCEAEGFRRIMYFYDRPDVLSVYTVRLEADKAACPVLLANGNRRAGGDAANGRHFAVWHDPFPKPSYLFACVGGDLESVDDFFTTRDGRKIELHIYVEHGKKARALYAMDSLKRAFAWDEEKFGRIYDLDIFNIVAVSDFNMGAMENKGLNIFNDRCVLAEPQTATDTDYADVERVVAHEYFHNWTGDRITCRDWFQLCLKEGLTVYRDQEFSSDQRSRPVQRLQDINFLKLEQFSEDAGPLAHPVRPRQYAEINNFYTKTVYEKGAELVRMLPTMLGAQGFAKGMDLYFARHDGQACAIEDFIQCFADSSGRDFSQFMLWYDQAGTPKVIVKRHYDAQAGVLTLTLRQSLRPTAECRVKQPMLIPIRFGFVGADGKDMPYHSSDAAIAGDVLLLSEAEQSFRFENLPQPPVPSLLRGFSAPIILETDLSEKEELFLAAHDSDLVNRYNMLHDLTLSALAAAARSEKAGAAALPQTAADIIALLLQTAKNETLEPAYRALCLQLPAEAEIAAAIGENIDPEAVYKARLAMAQALAAAGGTAFAALRGSHKMSGAFSASAEAAGKRAFNQILALYQSLAENSPALAAELYVQADNMTERLGAMQILTLHFPHSAEAEQALADYERRFADNPLAMDKWLTAQANISGGGALAIVQKLTEHSGFSYDNPNRVKALIEAFIGNPTGFHRQDGAAYRWAADIILRLDKTNPQLAAGLLAELRSWRQLEPRRRSAVQAELRRIEETPSLSPDVRDIVSRLTADE